MPNKDEKKIEEKSELDLAFDSGYASGRKYYLNDIRLEISDVDTSIKILEKYAPQELKVINELKNTLEILYIIEEKAESKRFL